MPPIANHGTRSVSRAARTSSRPPAADSGFVGVPKIGADAEVVRIAVELRRGRRREADDRVGADGPPRLGERRVVLPDVDAVGAGALDEVGPVVQHEERAVRVARAPERLGGPDELVVGELLVAQLHDVDAAAQGRVEQAARIAAVRPRLEHEIEPRAGEPRPTFGAVHGGGPYRPRCGAVRRGDRGRRHHRPRVCVACAAARPAASASSSAAPPGGGATRAAAGVLAPDPETPGFTALARRSAELWPAFAAELGDVGYTRCGSLVLAFDDSPLELDGELLDGAACRALEPGIAADCVGGLAPRATTRRSIRAAWSPRSRTGSAARCGRAPTSST